MVMATAHRTLANATTVTRLSRSAPCNNLTSTSRVCTSARQLFRQRPAGRLLSADQATATARRPVCMAAAQAESFVIVGSGRVGSALADLGGGSDVIIKRGQKVEGPPGPIIVTTRNNDLQAVVDATPEDRRKDLVFIQNGMLQPWLDERGLGDNTQVLVYFAVAKLGDKPQDGKTDTNPEGLTAATGKHAAAFEARLAASDLSCKVLDRTQYKKSMLEKLIWICALMAVGAKHGGSVGDVESQHTQEVSDLIEELGVGGAKALDVELDSGLVARLLAYSRSVASFPTAVKEFEWRNGWFYEQSKAALERGKQDPFPRHTAALNEVGAIP